MPKNITLFVCRQKTRAFIVLIKTGKDLSFCDKCLGSRCLASDGFKCLPFNTFFQFAATVVVVVFVFLVVCKTVPIVEHIQ